MSDSDRGVGGKRSMELKQSSIGMPRARRWW
jgi:hypothetical protein